jgi:hypothetical protein
VYLKLGIDQAKSESGGMHFKSFEKRLKGKKYIGDSEEVPRAELNERKS